MQQRPSCLAGCMPLMLLFAIIGMMSGMKNRAPKGIMWVDSPTAGFALARSEGRPVLLSFQTEGCASCQRMNQETFADEEVMQLAKRFVCIRVDSEGDPKLISKYRPH